MPVTEISKDQPLDTPSGQRRVYELPSDTRLDSEQHTTAGGVASAALRGFAPVATGMGVGAGIGALVGGPPGALVGAGIGGTAAALGEAALGLYDIAAPYLGTPQVPSPTGKALDVLGVPRPSTPTEQAVEFGAGVVAPGGALRAITAGRGMRPPAAMTPAQEAAAGKKFFEGIQPGRGIAGDIGELDRYRGAVTTAVERVRERGVMPKSREEFARAIAETKTD